MNELNVELPELEIGIFGAETFSDAMKKRISTGLGVEVFDIYGMTETVGVGTSGMDCVAHDGIHVWEDHYILELVDPKTGEPVEDGEARRACRDLDHKRVSFCDTFSHCRPHQDRL